MAPPRARRISPAQQALALRARYPDEPPPLLAAGGLQWTCRVRPTQISATYTVRIEHLGGGRRPKVRVLDPGLDDPWGKGLPHVFPGDELCLYYDEFDDRHDLIADKMMPWVSEWLYYYELWHSTGEWSGGGMEHERQQDRPDASSLATEGKASDVRAG